MLPDYIHAHLSHPSICKRPDLLDDMQATWGNLGMGDGARDLTRQEIAMLIEEHHDGAVSIADCVHEHWQTLSDVVETVRAVEGVGR